MVTGTPLSLSHVAHTGFDIYIDYIVERRTANGGYFGVDAAPRP